MKKLLPLACLLLASAARADDPYAAKTYPRSAARRLVVETDGGPVDLRQADGPIAVDVSPASPGDDCRVSQELRGSTLRLTARAPRNMLGLGKNCSAGFTVAGAFEEISVRSGSGKVALAMPCRQAEIKTGSGAISLHSMTGALTLRSGSGGISGDASAPRIDANAGSGDVALSSLTGPVFVKTGSGAVFLSWTIAPRRAAVDVRTGSGDLTALFPATARLKTSFRSGSGSLRSDFSDDERAGLELTFRSGSGGATIKKAP